jgi:hypothetical protein
MDIYKAIEELRTEKRRLDRAIEALEKNIGQAEARPERRAWNAGARRAASERMRQYWLQRKEGGSKSASSAHNVSPPSTERD